MPGGEQEDPSSRSAGSGEPEAGTAASAAVAAGEQPLRREKWLAEGRRGYASILAGTVLAVPLQAVVQSDAGGASSFIELLLIFLATYLGIYILLTAAVFRATPGHRYRAWAERSRPGSWVDHYRLGTRPGPGMAQAVGSLALVVGVFWYPRSGADSALPGWLTGALVVLLILESWLTVVMTYSVAYLVRDARSGYRELEFAGSGPRRFADYVYFSAGISTSFAAADVAIRTTGMRRTVTGHSILAFGFNTVILAAVVSVLLR